MMAPEERPAAEDVRSTFETLASPSVADAGETICRGTHQHDGATVEREYYRTDSGLLAVETAYVDGDRTVETVEECWLLTDGELTHTALSIPAFCRRHHTDEPAADVAHCRADREDEEPSITAGDVTSTFQPAGRVEVADGAPLRYTGVHEADRARIERSFYVDETRERLRVETVFECDGERLGSVVERHDLIDDGTFVERTGEPVDSFCRRTHLLDPAVDLQYCVRLASGPETPDGE